MAFPDEELSRMARKYSLINAIEHDGSANQGSVIGRILAENAELRKEANRVRSIVSGQVVSVNALSKEDQKKLLNEEFPGELEKQLAKKKEISRADSEKPVALPDLPDAKMGEVVTRFPPEPNGFMHIGHAKAAIIGFDYAQKYGGKFILRYDDTNPAAEKKEYYDAFRKSLDWLGLKPDLVKNASEDMSRFYELADRLIERSKGYVCNCTQEVMRQNRGNGTLCEHRSQTVEQNLGMWNEMLKGKIERRTSVLRFVGEMKSLNTTMRDPVLFRVVEEPHPLQGTKYLVWPTYDFDGPVEDSLDGVTHAMRSKEYELRDELYIAILESLKLRKPKIIEFSRLELRNTTVSKRNLRKLIEDGKVRGWDDPRLPTIAGLRRRGIVPQAIREFVISMGVSKVESEPTWDLLESINRKIIDPIAKRYFFVSEPVKLVVEGAPHLEVKMRYHPDNDYGERIISTDGHFLISGSDARQLKKFSRFRLIEGYNVEVTSLGDGEIVSRYLSDEKIEKIARIQWVPQASYLPLKILVPGPLLINGEFNPSSLQVIDGSVEKDFGNVSPDDMFQLVRFGFCRLDEAGTAILAHK